VKFFTNTVYNRPAAAVRKSSPKATWISLTRISEVTVIAEGSSLVETGYDIEFADDQGINDKILMAIDTFKFQQPRAAGC